MIFLIHKGEWAHVSMVTVTKGVLECLTLRCDTLQVFKLGKYKDITDCEVSRSVLSDAHP